MISLDKTYTTRNGREVKLFLVNQTAYPVLEGIEPHTQHILGAWLSKNNQWVAQQWRLDNGRCYPNWGLSKDEHFLDLIELPVTYSCWSVWYRSHSGTISIYGIYTTESIAREIAKEELGNHAFTVQRITVTEGEGLEK